MLQQQDQQTPQTYNQPQGEQSSFNQNRIPLVAGFIAVLIGGIVVWTFAMQRGGVRNGDMETVRDAEESKIIYGIEASKLCGPEPPASCAGGTGLGCRVIDKKWGCYPYTSAVDTSSWNTYRSEEFGFEFKYPQSLFLKESTLDSVTFGIKEWEEFNHSYKIFIDTRMSLFDNEKNKLEKSYAGFNVYRTPYIGHAAGSGDILYIPVDSNKVVSFIYCDCPGPDLRLDIISTFQFFE